MAKTGASTKGVILQPSVLTKRRLASSTIQLTFDQKVLAKTTSSVSATVERLMLTGIKARRRARQLQNLVLHANRRVPSREQILPPSFVARKKRNRRKARSLKKNRYVRRSLQKGSDNAH
ncbi:MAG: hypothetical protein ACXWRG_11450 [Bdellovibrio sp.]